MNRPVRLGQPSTWTGQRPELKSKASNGPTGQQSSARLQGPFNMPNMPAPVSPRSTSHNMAPRSRLPASPDRSQGQPNGAYRAYQPGAQRESPWNGQTAARPHSRPMQDAAAFQQALPSFQAGGLGTPYANGGSWHAFNPPQQLPLASGNAHWPAAAPPSAYAPAAHAPNALWGQAPNAYDFPPLPPAPPVVMPGPPVPLHLPLQHQGPPVPPQQPMPNQGPPLPPRQSQTAPTAQAAAGPVPQAMTYAPAGHWAQQKQWSTLQQNPPTYDPPPQQRPSAQGGSARGWLRRIFGGGSQQRPVQAAPAQPSPQRPPQQAVNAQPHAHATVPTQHNPVQAALPQAPFHPPPPAGQAVPLGAFAFKPNRTQRESRLAWQQQMPALPTDPNHLPANFSRLFQEFQLRSTHATLPAFTDAQLIGKSKRLGSGSFNTVFSMKLKKMGPDGKVHQFNGVFKPLNKTEGGCFSQLSGIPHDNPQIAMRNLATQDFARKLRLDVIPETSIAVMGEMSNKPTLGLMMEHAGGKGAWQLGAQEWARADVRREVTKLQLLDHLTGQGDRHIGNYFVELVPVDPTRPNGEKYARVRGIDNDQCFGHKITDPSEIRRDDSNFRYNNRGVNLPPVVDTEMAARIRAMSHEDVRNMLNDKLNPFEVKAAIDRLDGMKTHLYLLERKGLIIGPDQWNDPQYTSLMTAENSYAGRDAKW